MMMQVKKESAVRMLRHFRTAARHGQEGRGLFHGSFLTLYHSIPTGGTGSTADVATLQEKL
jgi:hypothetical protein